MDYRTCTYIHDDGGIFNSAAVTDRNLCLYHLRHRARLMRMAQYRARDQRFDLQLPPLESMFAVQSALTQLSEALAADMIDLKRADRLIRVLNIASRNLLKSDKWPASPYHSDQPAPAVDLAADYGLPNDLDLNLPTEVAFPSRTHASALSETDNCPPTTDNRFSSPMPTMAYCKDGPGCPEHTIRADFPVTPEAVEIVEIAETLGSDAAARRGGQLQRNRQRRQLTSDRKRYAAIAMEKNMQIAAERLAEQKIAGKQAQEDLAARKPPTSVASGDTIAFKEEAIA
ncbi:MAG TPA: hypothetical protein VII23_25305 [Terriglobales bacterium]